jgi:hypothetical protein
MNPTKCADGTYTLKTTASSSTECVTCPAGYACDCTLDSTSTWCTGAASITPCTAGKYCAAGTKTATVDCQAGYICPTGAFAQVPCPPGYTCDGTGNTDSSKVQCPAGKYCTGGTTTSTYIDCPAGMYCPAGSRYYIPCAIGTYNSNTGASTVAECLACPAGSTCTARGQVQDDAASFDCAAGYYCPDDTTVTMCPKGYYCPAKSSQPTTCAAGKYTDNLASASCTDCPAGFYCGDDNIEAFADATTSSIIADKPIACVAGQYCPKKSYILTSSGLPGTSCPIGTFNPNIGGRNAGDCIDCPEGYLCTTAGLSDNYAALTQCPAGYYCPGASISKSAIVCPTGAYCPAGSVYFIECSVGTFQDLTGK